LDFAEKEPASGWVGWGRGDQPDPAAACSIVFIRDIRMTFYPSFCIMQSTGKMEPAREDDAKTQRRNLLIPEETEGQRCQKLT